MPDGFVEAWNQAVQSKSRAAKGLLFNKWLTAGGDWALITLLQKHIGASSMHAFQLANTWKSCVCV